MKKYIAEFAGTFALVFCGTGAIVINEITNGQIGHEGIAITFGLIVMAMIYALGDISGTHINPAVSLALAIAGKFDKKELLPYMAAQLAGAMAASGLLKILFPASVTLGATIPAGSNFTSFVLEFILTFILMLVIVQVTGGSKEKKQLAGFIIGGVVLLEAMFAGPVCGASMNPFRSLAPAIVSGTMEQVWIYLIAPTAGAIAAVFFAALLPQNTD